MLSCELKPEFNLRGYVLFTMKLMIFQAFGSLGEIKVLTHAPHSGRIYSLSLDAFSFPYASL